MVEKAITERELAATVRELAETYGWRCYSVLDTRIPAKRTSKGFPDLVMLHPGSEDTPSRIIFAELKTQSGQLTAEQAIWLELLDRVESGCENTEVYLWRPSDLTSGRIERILSGG